MDVYAINTHERIAILDDGKMVPIVTLLDCEGDETEDPDCAEIAVAGSTLSGWWAVLISNYETTLEN